MFSPLHFGSMVYAFGMRIPTLSFRDEDPCFWAEDPYSLLSHCGSMLYSSELGIHALLFRTTDPCSVLAHYGPCFIGLARELVLAKISAPKPAKLEILRFGTDCVDGVMKSVMYFVLQS